MKADGGKPIGRAESNNPKKSNAGYCREYAQSLKAAKAAKAQEQAVDALLIEY